jgi:hypothetical protein
MREDQIVASTNCVNVRFAGTGLDVDVVPVLYEGEPNDVGYLVSKDDGTRLSTSVRLHLDFIRSRKKAHPKHLAQLIRFTKWWARQQQKRDGEFKCKSFMLELLWGHLADGGLKLGDYAIALERFFAQPSCSATSPGQATPSPTTCSMTYRRPRPCATSGKCWSARASCPHVTSTWSAWRPGWSTCCMASQPTMPGSSDPSRTGSCCAAHAGPLPAGPSPGDRPTSRALASWPPWTCWPG